MNELVLIPEEVGELKYIDICSSLQINKALDKKTDLESKIHESVGIVADNHQQYYIGTELNPSESEVQAKERKDNLDKMKDAVNSFKVRSIKDRLDRMKSGQLTDDDREFLSENKDVIEEIASNNEVDDKDAPSKDNVIEFCEETKLAHNPPSELNETDRVFFLTTAIQNEIAQIGEIVNIKTDKVKEWMGNLTITSTPLSSISKKSILVLTTIVLTVLSGDMVAWYLIGALAFGLKPILAVFFSVIPTALAKVLSLPYIDNIKKIEKSDLTYSSLHGFKILVFTLGLLVLSGGISVFSETQLTEVRIDNVDKSLEALVDYARSGNTSTEAISLAESNEPSENQIVIYKGLQLYSSLFLKFLLAFSLTWVGAILMAWLTVKSEALDKKNNYLSSKHDLFTLLSEYEKQSQYLRELVKRTSHIRGLIALHSSKMKNFGNN